MKVHIQYMVEGRLERNEFSEKDGLIGFAPSPIGALLIFSKDDKEIHRFYGDVIFAEVTYEHEPEPSLIVPDKPNLIVASA